MDISYYIELLEENRNIVLTGAPGTGKTWLAKEIANKMNAEWTFVQFHPSYDYTDFVEGLRPIQDNRNGIVFERKDGVFKAFCKKAIETSKTEKPNVHTSSLYKCKDTSFESIYRSVVDDIKNERITGFQSTRKWKVLTIKGDTIIFDGRSEKKENFQNFYNYFIENKIFDIKNYDKNKLNDTISSLTNGNTNTLDYKEYKWLLGEMLNRAKKIMENNKLEVSDLPVTDLEDIRANISHDNTEQTYGNAKFVFIIDEINRGELSKIFGELFYAIDPGYRGKDGLVKTQYQNLVGKDDAFADGFYVPENVYIIATMNDIDRSVESMDFAMRRRFMWIEVTPDDRSEMLYDLKDDNICREAIARMHSLNEVIAETDGLGKSFQIGPAYFLKSEKLGFNLLWRLRLEPLLREYLRGFRNAEEKLLEFEAAYKSHATDNDSSNDVQP
ncbi:MAG: AAA family ATPase [Bacteroidaceae bacterium]|nr:AAA family ATPase [Bacteroidaceae bacterium]